MINMRHGSLPSILVLAASLAASSGATETENLNMQVLPASGTVTVDGGFDDWDLSSGIFACGDAESQRDNYGVWIHAMYDAANVYVLARWTDSTPMNNPGTVKGDYGFRGDCLQVRFVTAPDVDSPAVLRIGAKDLDAERMRSSSWDCWADRDGLDAMGGQYGRNFNEGTIPDPKGNGAAQAFRKAPDGKGYTQEIRFPWKLLTKPDSNLPLQAGTRFLLTVEPNFTVGTTGRLTIKDIFRARSAIDRVFTFRAQSCWGVATCVAKGGLDPRPVRLADGREFGVRMEKGLPAIDWTGLIRQRELTGHKAIRFSMPEDGYVSLNLYSPSNTVVRQLLTAAFFTKGDHTVQWDGLGTYSVRVPGSVVPPGSYTVKALYHKGLGLAFRGWACSGIAAPGDTAAGIDQWGGDHGDPQAAAAAGGRVFLGWSGAEGGKALVACDLSGSTLWRNLRGGIGSASLLAADASQGPDGTVYAVNTMGQYAPIGIYRLNARTGVYTEWSATKATDLLPKHIWGRDKGVPAAPGYLAAGFGTVYAGYSGTNRIAVIDGDSGQVRKWIEVNRPGDIEVIARDRIVVVSGGRDLLAIDVAKDQITKIGTVPTQVESAWVPALAVDRQGNIYAATREGEDRIYVLDASGKLLRTIGRQSRVKNGPWVQDSLRNVTGMTIDDAGKLWVTEGSSSPRRVSAWDAATGAFEREFFGAASYGGTGGAVNPVDPDLMVGQGCEWRIDRRTGRAACVGVVGGANMGISRFGFSADGRLFLATTAFRTRAPVMLFERVGEGQYKRRAGIWPADRKAGSGIRVWADANDDQEEQPEEITTHDLAMSGWISGWYMSMAPDLSFYGSDHQIRVTGYTACGAPVYDLKAAVPLPTPDNLRGRGGMGAELGMGSADGRLMVYNGHYGADHSTMDCYDIASGRRVWTYPSNFTGVHGSHRAPGPEAGLIRGAYDICGTAKLPPPIGNIWLVPTNKGEWHVLTEDGFYLSHLFQSDPMKWQYPERMVPGARIDQCPPGAGEEAFGGSMTQGKDGKLYVQVGHTSFWNVEVVGLDQIRPLPAVAPVTIAERDLAQAREYREKALQASVGTKSLVVRQKSVTFTGSLDKDFAGGTILAFQKNEGAGVRASLAWDAEKLYAAWEVKDNTPWVNGADAPEFLYARGDTVDLQLATVPEKQITRGEAAAGDLRLSIGNFQGKPTAVLYRKVALTKKPMTFNSGVVKGYVMESVTVEDGVTCEVKVDKARKTYTVEAAIPLRLLGLEPADGLTLRGDLGATHGNTEGNDTAIRTYWNNQSTGIVSDEVFELKMEPRNWGEWVFQAADAI